MAQTTLHDEAVKVLRAAGKPLHVNEIWTRIAQRGFYQTDCLTPKRTLVTILLRKTPGVRVGAATK